MTESSTDPRVTSDIIKGAWEAGARAVPDHEIFVAAIVSKALRLLDAKNGTSDWYVDVTKKALAEWPTFHVIKNGMGEVVALCPMFNNLLPNGQFSYALDVLTLSKTNPNNGIDFSENSESEATFWADISTAPAKGRFLVKGPSGYLAPNDIHIETVRRDPSWRGERFINDGGDNYLDSWQAPTHWKPLTSAEDATFAQREPRSVDK